MTEEPKFQVLVSGFYSCSIEEWLRSRRVPVSELPELTEDENEFARRFKIPEEEYARHRLANLYGEQRIVRQAVGLGRLVEEFLENLGDGYGLLAVRADLSEGPKSLEIQKPQGVVVVPISGDVVGDSRDAHGIRSLEKLKNLVAASLGRTDVVLRKP